MKRTMQRANKKDFSHRNNFREGREYIPRAQETMLYTKGLQKVYTKVEVKFLHAQLFLWKLSG